MPVSRFIFGLDANTHEKRVEGKAVSSMKLSMRTNIVAGWHQASSRYFIVFQCSRNPVRSPKVCVKISKEYIEVNILFFRVTWVDILSATLYRGTCFGFRRDLSKLGFAGWVWLWVRIIAILTTGDVGSFPKKSAQLYSEKNRTKE